MNDPGNSDRDDARFRAVAQIAEDLQALVRLFREQGLSHPDLARVRQQLHTQLFIYLQIHDMLAIDLVGGELSFEGKPLPGARELARPLHRVGVRQLVMESGLEPGELIALTNAWTNAVEHPKTNFAQDLDDFDLDHIWLTLAGPGSISAPPADDPPAHDSAPAAFELASDPPPPIERASDPPPVELASKPPPRRRIERSQPRRDSEPRRAHPSEPRRAPAPFEDDFELEVPESEPQPPRAAPSRPSARRAEPTAPAAEPAPEAGAEMGPDAPPPDEPSEPKGSWPGGLSPDEASQLREAIAGDDAGAAQAALATLMMAAGPAPDAKRLLVARLMKQGLASLAQRGRFDLLLSAYQLEVPEEAFDPRSQLLADPELLGPALDALERFPSDELSLLLARAPSEASRPLIERALRQPRGPVREEMKHLLYAIPVSGQVLTEALPYADDDLGELFLHMASRNPEGVPQSFWQAALEHPHATVRSGTLARMAHHHYDALCELIYPLLADPDRTIRRAALDLIMRRHDVRAAPFLAVRIEAREIPTEELHSVVVALGRLGTGDASRALREQFEQRRDAKIKGAILLALTQVEGEGARELLQKHAEKRFFANRQVRDAAEQGLKRLDAKIAGRKFRPTPWEDATNAPSGPPPPATQGHAPGSMAAPPSGSAGPRSRAPESFAPPSPQPAATSNPPAEAFVPTDFGAATSAPAGQELELELELDGPQRRQTETEPGAPASAASARRSRTTEDDPNERNGPPSNRRARTEDAPSEQARAGRRQITSKPVGGPAKQKRDTTHRKITNHTMAAVDDNTVDRVDMRRLRRLSSHRALRAERSEAPEPPRRPPSHRTSEAPAFARTAKRLLEGGALDEALAVLEEAKKEHDDQPELFALIATVYEERGDLSEAVDALHEAVLLAPDRNDLAERLYALREREVGQR